MSASGPGCVKTCTSRECAELFSLFSSFDSDCESGSFVIQRNRDKLSTRKFDVAVFTQRGVDSVEKVFFDRRTNFFMRLVRCSCENVRDHIVSHRNEHRPPYWSYSALPSLKIDIRENFDAAQFSTFQQYPVKSRPQ